MAGFSDLLIVIAVSLLSHPKVHGQFDTNFKYSLGNTATGRDYRMKSKLPQRFAVAMSLGRRNASSLAHKSRCYLRVRLITRSN